MYAEALVLVVGVIGILSLVLRKKKSKDPGYRAWLINGMELSKIDVVYNAAKGTVVWLEGDMSWLVPPEAKPAQFWKEDDFRRMPLFACVVGELYVRKIEIPVLSEKLRKALLKTKALPAGHGLSKDEQEDLKKLGIKIKEPIAAAMITAEGTIDNRELNRIIDGSIREVFREPSDSSQGILIGVVVGAMYALTLSSFIPTSILRSPMFGTILSLVFFAAIILVYMYQSGGE